MIYIIHRVNKISQLKTIDEKYGVEVDIRINNQSLYLNHEPDSYGDNFETYLDNFKHKFLIANIKDSGIEDRVIKILRDRNISFFLLDVEFPYIFQSIEENFRDIAIRLSLFEPYENFLTLHEYLDWVWVDSYKINPLEKINLSELKEKKISLVCPSRWNRKSEIYKYKEFAKKNNLSFHSIMTSFENIQLWNE